MQPGKLVRSGPRYLWPLGTLGLAVEWQPGMPLYLVSFPWPGDEAGIREPVSEVIYRDIDAAHGAVRVFAAALPW